MDKEQPTESPSQHRSHFPWATLILAVTIVAIAALIYNSWFRTGRAIKEIAVKFKTGTITNTFVESIPDISPTLGDVLELTTSRSDEIFKHSDSKSILWDAVYLGTTVSEVRVPTTFRYHIRLSDKWRLASKGQVCYVLAPPIHPSLPPAIDTRQMEKSTANGWALFNKDDNLLELERNITPELEKRACDEKHIKLVREACRQSVAAFVKKWLTKEDQWRNDLFSSIVVVFPDEAAINSDQELEQHRYEPAVKLD